MTLAHKIVWLLVLAAFAKFVSAQKSTEFTSSPLPSVSNVRSFVANERHLQATAFAALYANSAFAHGYRHGYEEGFHTGDLDLHMGRDVRIILKSKEYQQQGRREYNLAFGSKQLFQDGYQAGFRSGYTDAISGAEFRASDRIRALSTGLTVLPPTRRSHFDNGFAEGFKSARSADAPKQGINSDYVEQYCHSIATGPYALEYCSGFGRGYMLGAFDAPPAIAKIVDSKTNRR